MARPRVVFLTRDEVLDSTAAMVNAVRDIADPVGILAERYHAHRVFRSKRKAFGFVSALGQMLFLGIAYPLVKRSARRRVADIERQFAFDTRLDPERVIQVGAVLGVTGADAIEHLQRLDPDLVIVNGTRLLRPRVLQSIRGRFVNVHLGITPEYRGVFTGYWAMVRNDPGRCGVTVHEIDDGIDTGAVLEQAVVELTPEDNAHSCAVLQRAIAVSMVRQVVERFAAGKLESRPSRPGTYPLWTHPTLWQYLWNWLRHGVR